MIGDIEVNGMHTRARANEELHTHLHAEHVNWNSTDTYEHVSIGAGGRHAHLQSPWQQIITKRRPLTDSPTLCKDKNDKTTETGLDVSSNQLFPQLHHQIWDNMFSRTHLNWQVTRTHLILAVSSGKVLVWAWRMAMHAHYMHQSI